LYLKNHVEVSASFTAGLNLKIGNKQVSLKADKNS